MQTDCNTVFGNRMALYTIKANDGDVTLQVLDSKSPKQKRVKQDVLILP